MTREKFVNASFRFVLKPTDVLSYGAHCVDPDIALHWPNILQILVPTFSSYSVAQGFVSSENDEDEDLAGEEAAERRRRVEEEKEGRSCPICLSKPVAGRMTKCGHVRATRDVGLTLDFLLPLHSALHCVVRRAKGIIVPYLWRYHSRGYVEERAVSGRRDDGQGSPG